MSVRLEVLPFLAAALLTGVALALLIRALRVKWRKAACIGAAVALVLAGYFVYFFRDPIRVTPRDATALIAAADGTIAAVTELTDDQFRTAARFAGLDGDRLEAFLGNGVVRISIFLSLFDVHVNRAPLSGRYEFLGYFPGQHLFTFHAKSSEVNQHNSIFVRSPNTVCLINQIVGPVCRRVVYWPDHDRAVPLEAGAPIGMMKFGSRLDTYVPANVFTMLLDTGAVVRAGETIVARLREEPKP